MLKPSETFKIRMTREEAPRVARAEQHHLNIFQKISSFPAPPLSYSISAFTNILRFLVYLLLPQVQEKEEKIRQHYNFKLADFTFSLASPRTSVPQSGHFCSRVSSSYKNLDMGLCSRHDITVKKAALVWLLTVKSVSHLIHAHPSSPNSQMN